MCGGSPKPTPPPPPPPPPTRLAELERGQTAPTRKKAATRSLRSVASKKTRAKGAGVVVAGNGDKPVSTAKRTKALS